MATPYLDLSSPTLDVTSAAVHEARERSWVAETPWGWAVLRYDEAAAILRDRRFRQGNARWPEQNGIHSGVFHDWWAETLLSLEGDDHARLRRLLNPAFKRGAIERLVPGFSALAHELVDGFCATGRVELVHDFAEPYAARVLCVILGLEEEHWPQVARWADDLGRSFAVDVADHVPRIEAALAGLTAYVGEVVADRRRSPRDDLVSTLVAAPALSERELSVALVFLAFAGLETTRNQLGLAVRTLLAHPDQWALLGRDPSLGRACVEEVMRVNPTVTWVTREAVVPVEVGGLRIPAGGIVQVLSHAAGTDPAAMAEPGFDLTRGLDGSRPPHLGFGSGVHHCLGHFVARTDMAAALPILAARMPDARPDGPGEWMPVSGNTGAVRYPIRFTPTSSGLGSAPPAR